jgi:hypothetical protein
METTDALIIEQAEKLEGIVKKMLETAAFIGSSEKQLELVVLATEFKTNVRGQD